MEWSLSESCADDIAAIYRDGNWWAAASRTERLKGIAEPQSLHEVIWGPQVED